MTGTPSEMLGAYVRAFETLRGENVVPFYELPCTFIRPDGAWVVHEADTVTTRASPAAGGRALGRLQVRHQGDQS